jgi:uncharacterized protein (TIGR00255 family)
MVLSMTGFGGASGAVDGVEYSVEVRSVNNRYLKTTLKLPESWSQSEYEIDRMLRQKVQRGTVTVSVRMRIPDDQAASKVNTSALLSYVEQLRVVEMEANPTLRIDLAALLQLPGVCESRPMDELVSRTEAGLMKLIEQALSAMMEMRRREGETIREDLLANCKALETNLALVEARAPKVVGEYQQRLTARVAELTAGANLRLDEQDLAREVALFAERCDVAEEISRLKAHLDQFRAVLNASESGGRKLDFIAQEMLRESNTIASKSSDADIARAVVEMKTAVDRIKEQVQNVE